jgi:hypothetical protein
MNVYPYKTIKSGKYTKYLVSIAENGSVLVEYYFKNKCKTQILFETPLEIKKSKFPAHIKEVSLWAKYESKSLVSY